MSSLLTTLGDMKKKWIAYLLLNRIVSFDLLIHIYMDYFIGRQFIVHNIDNLMLVK